MLKTWAAAVLTAIAAFGHGQPQAQVHRCVLPDGRVAYSDRPCDGQTLPAQLPAQRTAPVAAPSVPVRETPAPAARARPVAATSAAGQASPPSALQWTGSPGGDLARASAVIDVAEMRGKDCEWVIKVTRQDYAVCDEFMRMAQPQGPVHQAARKLQELANDPQLRRSHAQQLARAATAARRVVQLREFVSLAR